MQTELKLSIYTVPSGGGQVTPLLKKTATVELVDGFLDDDVWQKHVLDLCHNVHLWSAAKWDAIPHFELYVGDDRLASWTIGGSGRKAPSVPHLVIAVATELVRLALRDGKAPEEVPPQ